MVNQAKKNKLAALAKKTRTGGRGSVRRKVRKKTKAAGSDDKKVLTALRKAGCRGMGAFDEANFFHANGVDMLHFDKPNVEGQYQANVFSIGGKPKKTTIAESLTTNQFLINQLSRNQINKLQEIFASNPAMMASAAADDSDDDDIPELEGDFEDAAAE